MFICSHVFVYTNTLKIKYIKFKNIISCFLDVSFHFSFSYNVSTTPEYKDSIIHFVIILPLIKIQIIYNFVVSTVNSNIFKPLPDTCICVRLLKFQHLVKISFNQQS